MKNIKLELLLISVALIWGITFLMVQDAIKDIEVFSFLFYRFGIATIFMYFLFFKKYQKISKKTLIFAIALGIALFSAYYAQTYALIYTLSSIVALLTGTIVIFTPLISFLFLKEKLKTNIIFISILSFIGLYLLTSSSIAKFGIGEIAGTIGALFFAIHLIITSKISKDMNIYNVVLLQFLTITILSLVVSLMFEQATINITLNFAIIKAILVTSIFATVYAFLIQTLAQQHISSMKTAIIFILEPFGAIFYGVYVGNEILVYTQMIGAGLIMLAPVLMEIKPKSLYKNFIQKTKL